MTQIQTTFSVVLVGTDSAGNDTVAELAVCTGSLLVVVVTVCGSPTGRD